MPVLPLREFVVFPYMVLPLFVARERSIAAVEDALAGDRLLLLCAQRNAELDEPAPDDLHRVGTIAMVMRILRLADGRVKVLVQGLGKARIEAPLRVVFHTEFTYDQVQRMDLELVELAFTKSSELQGAVGIAEAEINLYTKKRIIPIEITAMKSKSDYLITVKEELEPGAYAFHTQGTLAPKDQESFAKIPENLRIAFPLELR